MPGYVIPLVVAGLLSVSATRMADEPKLPASPEGLPRHVLAEVSTTYRDLTTRGRTLTEDIRSHHARCDHVASTDTTTIKACQISAADIEMTWPRYDVEVGEYGKTLADLRTKFPLSRYAPAGHGLVLGLTAIGGFNVPPSSDAATEARLRAELGLRLTDAQTRAGLPPAQHVHTEGYNFILGLATAPLTSPQDLERELERAFADTLTMGDMSRLTREVYPSLTGRDFDILECHSNGAMVCLSALEHGDAAARVVRLLGPQITNESLNRWERLIERHYTTSVKVYWMSGDPIPSIALAAGGIVENASRVAAENLRNRIFSSAPALEFQTLPCPLSASSVPTVECHSVRLYQEALAAAR